MPSAGSLNDNKKRSAAALLAAAAVLIGFTQVVGDDQTEPVSTPRADSVILFEPDIPAEPDAEEASRPFMVVIPDGAVPVQVDPNSITVRSDSTSRSASQSSSEASAPALDNPGTAPSPPTTQIVPPTTAIPRPAPVAPSGPTILAPPTSQNIVVPGPIGELDADAGIFVDDPEGNLADVDAGAASAGASAAAAGDNPLTNAETSTAVDNDRDAIALAQGFASVDTGSESDQTDPATGADIAVGLEAETAPAPAAQSGAVAVAVAAAADNNVLEGEPEIEAEAEIETDDSGGLLEVYAEAGVLLVSESATGQDGGSSFVVESAVVIIRDGEIVVVRGDATTGRVEQDGATSGDIVNTEQTYSINPTESILGEQEPGGEPVLPESALEQILTGLSESGEGAAAFTNPADSIESGEASTETNMTTTTVGEQPADSVPESTPTTILPPEWEGIDGALAEYTAAVLAAVANNESTSVSFADDDLAEDPANNSSVPVSNAIRSAGESIVQNESEAEGESSSEAEAEAEAEANASRSGSASAAAAGSGAAATGDAQASTGNGATAVGDNASSVSTGTSTEAVAGNGSEQNSTSDGTDARNLLADLEAVENQPEATTSAVGGTGEGSASTPGNGTNEGNTDGVDPQ